MTRMMLQAVKGSVRDRIDSFIWMQKNVKKKNGYEPVGNTKSSELLLIALEDIV